MSAVRTGWIAHEDLQERAAALSGALAECSVGALALVDHEGWVEFEPRTTDLPGVILEALERGGADLLALDRALRIELRPDGFSWATDDEDAAARLGALDPAARMDD